MRPPTAPSRRARSPSAGTATRRCSYESERRLSLSLPETSGFGRWIPQARRRTERSRISGSGGPVLVATLADFLGRPVARRRRKSGQVLSLACSELLKSEIPSRARIYGDVGGQQVGDQPCRLRGRWDTDFSEQEASTG